MKQYTRIFNLLQRPLILVILLLAIVMLLQRIRVIPSFSEWFKSKPLLIENTALVIKEVKNIAELSTAQLYAELIADSTVATQAGRANATLRSIGMMPIPMPETRQLVLIVKGKVKAGIRLEQIPDSNVLVQGDSVRIRLPKAEILEVITNPADFETFIETGTWSNAEITAVKNKARKKLLEEAARQQLLQQAQTRASIVLEQFLRSSGFKKVTLLPPAP